MKIKKIKQSIFVVITLVIGVAATGVIFSNLHSADETRAAGGIAAYSLNDWVYYDPVSGQNCNSKNYWTPFDQDTTCYRWSVFTDNDTDSSSTVKLILDHNITHATFANKDAAMNNIVSTWADYSGEASFASEEELMNAMRLDHRPTLSNNSINGGEKNTNLMVNNSYYLNGQLVNHAGFWTATVYEYDNAYAYTFTEFGNNAVVESTRGRGVRPVIIADKSKLTAEPSRKDITSTVTALPSYKYKPVYREGVATFRSLQGFTVTNNDLVFYAYNANAQGNGLLFGYTGNDFSSDGITPNPQYIAGGHGNDMTFNPNTNEVLMTGPNEYSEIWLLNADTLAKTGSIETASSSKVSKGFGTIGYNGKDNLYIGGSSATAYIMNTGFNQIKDSIDMPKNNIGQGLEFHKGYIFKTSWTDYVCTGHLYCSEDEVGSAAIDVYDAKFNKDGTVSKNFGRHIKTLYINGSANLGELESISFHEDDTYLGFTSPKNSNGTCKVRDESDPETKERCFIFYHFPYSSLDINLDTAVSYTDASDSITINISSSAQLQPTGGYAQASDGYGLTKTVYAGSINETVQVCDRYSNCSTVNVSHENSSYKQPQIVTFASNYVNKTYGDTNFTNTATTDGDGTISYSSDNTAVAEVNSATGEVSIKGAGTANITAVASQTETYSKGISSYTLSVAKATSTKPSEIENVLFGAIGEPLSTITFSTKGINWEDGNITILSGENEYQVNYTQNNDTTNYTTEIFSVTVKGLTRYIVVEGDQQVYIKGESEVASFRIDIDYSIFEEYGHVYVDEQLLSPDSYKAESGSTIISLKKAYVDNLAIGQHSFKIIFGDFGIATAQFEVKNASQDSDDAIANKNDISTPNTGNNTDNDNEFVLDLVHIILLGSIIASVIFYIMHRRSIKHRKF